MSISLSAIIEVVNVNLGIKRERLKESVEAYCKIVQQMVELGEDVQTQIAMIEEDTAELEELRKRYRKGER